MQIDLREYPLPFTRAKCERYGLDPSQLYEHRIMQFILYAEDAKDYEQKIELTETTIDRSLTESFLMSKNHLINRVLKKIEAFYGNVDKGSDEAPVRAVCNMMVNNHKIIELDLPGSEGNMYAVLCHPSYKKYLDNITSFVINCLEIDDGTILSRLRLWAKRKELIELGLAQKYPEDWDKMILTRLSYLGYLQVRWDGSIVTPKSAFS